MFQNYRQRKVIKCTFHYIAKHQIETIVLKAIKEITDFAKENKEEFLKVIKSASEERREVKHKENKAKLVELELKNKELYTLITKLYENFPLSKIKEKRYDRLIEKYNIEQVEIENGMENLKEKIESYDIKKLNIENFFDLIDKYTEFNELTTPMLNEYIEKIIVYEGTGKHKNRKQQIDIYFNFIGDYVMEKSVF